MKILRTYPFQSALITKQYIERNSPYFNISHKNAMFCGCLIFDLISVQQNVELCAIFAVII